MYQGEQGAVAAREQVRGELNPWLDQSTSAVDNLEQKHKEIKENLESINDNLDKMSDLSSACKRSYGSLGSTYLYTNFKNLKAGHKIPSYSYAKCILN